MAALLLMIAPVPLIDPGGQSFVATRFSRASTLAMHSDPLFVYVLVHWLVTSASRHVRLALQVRRCELANKPPLESTIDSTCKERAHPRYSKSSP